jgi:hypothetical protein
MLVLPIHGQPNDVLSDIISNLKGYMRHRLAAGGTLLFKFFLCFSDNRFYHGADFLQVLFRIRFKASH